MVYKSLVRHLPQSPLLSVVLLRPPRSNSSSNHGPLCLSERACARVSVCACVRASALSLSIFSRLFQSLGHGSPALTQCCLQHKDAVWSFIIPDVQSEFSHRIQIKTPAQGLKKILIKR